jgi:hypothetical protein
MFQHAAVVKSAPADFKKPADKAKKTRIQQQQHSR